MRAFCLSPRRGRWFYNRVMAQLQHLTPVFLALYLGLSGLAAAQTPPVGDKPAATAAAAESASRTDQRIERIHIEDAGSRIDELRVGGETQSITVAPKGGMPAYEVLPANTSQGLTTGQRGNSTATGGTRVWKILGF